MQSRPSEVAEKLQAARHAAAASAELATSLQEERSRLEASADCAEAGIAAAEARLQQTAAEARRAEEELAAAARTGEALQARLAEVRQAAAALDRAELRDAEARGAAAQRRVPAGEVAEARQERELEALRRTLAELREHRDALVAAAPGFQRAIPAEDVLASGSVSGVPAEAGDPKAWSGERPRVRAERVEPGARMAAALPPMCA